MIFETIVITVDDAGNAHVTPFGIRRINNQVVISPFKPSTTLNNILATQCAVVNYSDDVRVFAAALTQRQAWQLTPARSINGFFLQGTLAHQELKLVQVHDDDLRPTLTFDVVHEVNHQPFQGYNRAQASVLELAVLVSRLNRLPMDKIQAEIQYLQIAIDKTAGERELEAWEWLIEKVRHYQAEVASSNLA